MNKFEDISLKNKFLQIEITVIRIWGLNPDKNYDF